MDLLPLSLLQTRRLRLRAQNLLQPSCASPAELLTSVFAVQAQDLPAGRLSLRARSAGLSDAQVETARLETHAIAWTWCLRNTLHLISAADARWLIPLLAPGRIASARMRLRQLGWDEALLQQGLGILHAALRTPQGLAHGLRRSELIPLLKENGLPWEGQAPVHLFGRAAFAGELLRGPLYGAQESYVAFESWIGALQPLPRPEALGRLAQRYLAAYAPAAPPDLAKWSGLTAAEARQAFQLSAGPLVPVSVLGNPAWLLESQLPWLAEPDEPGPILRLLPRFDTLLMGYASRDWLLDPAYAPRVFQGGVIKPALLADGQLLGVWNAVWRKNGRTPHLEISIEPFAPLDARLLPLIDAEVADIGRFLDVEVQSHPSVPGKQK
jgi:hypothetical protein